MYEMNNMQGTSMGVRVGGGCGDIHWSLQLYSIIHPLSLVDEANILDNLR